MFGDEADGSGGTILESLKPVTPKIEVLDPESPKVKVLPLETPVDKMLQSDPSKVDLPQSDNLKVELPQTDTPKIKVFEPETLKVEVHQPDILNVYTDQSNTPMFPAASNEDNNCFANGYKPIGTDEKQNCEMQPITNEALISLEGNDGDGYTVKGVASILKDEDWLPKRGYHACPVCQEVFSVKSKNYRKHFEKHFGVSAGFPTIKPKKITIITPKGQFTRCRRAKKNNCSDPVDYSCTNCMVNHND